MGDKNTTPNLADPALPACRCALCSSLCAYDAASRDEHATRLHSLLDFFISLQSKTRHRAIAHIAVLITLASPSQTAWNIAKPLHEPQRCSKLAHSSIPHPGGAIHLPEYLSLRVQLHHRLGSGPIDAMPHGG
ncbi:hypothetical protein HBI25_115300 [Parastagonospora nodorum]|nr:hypothetical protein HBH54_067290 [Parastagonospora nodorum]KAH4075986.1 hypothetical protein HBH50_024290 [Parastagonospora nodorum]KAH4142971.1 hypothetical protein HBH45_048240 [Parastagonospora nodorum]KAH4815877.1 hypothetical protein HBH61_064180 [Parastagonospora nodorum]KAH5065982.1 hypothetical protein HBI73_198450 [Parastagonospora nodorum]